MPTLEYQATCRMLLKNPSVKKALIRTAFTPVRPWEIGFRTKKMYFIQIKARQFAFC